MVKTGFNTRSQKYLSTNLKSPITSPTFIHTSVHSFKTHLNNNNTKIHIHNRLTQTGTEVHEQSGDIFLHWHRFHIFTSCARLVPGENQLLRELLRVLTDFYHDSGFMSSRGFFVLCLMFWFLVALSVSYVLPSVFSPSSLHACLPLSVSIISSMTSPLCLHLVISPAPPHVISVSVF